jgi:hypothetical protein
MEQIRVEELRRALQEAADRIAKPVVETLEILHRKQIRKVMDIPTLGPGASTDLKDCEAVDLNYIRYLAVTVQGRLDPSATASLRVHVRSSVDGGKWDDADVSSFDLPLASGKTVQKTQTISPDYAKIKVIVENLDTLRPAYDIRAWVIY